MRGFESRLNPSRPDFNLQDDEVQAVVQAGNEVMDAVRLGRDSNSPKAH